MNGTATPSFKMYAAFLKMCLISVQRIMCRFILLSHRALISTGILERGGESEDAWAWKAWRWDLLTLVSLMTMEWSRGIRRGYDKRKRKEKDELWKRKKGGCKPWRRHVWVWGWDDCEVLCLINLYDIGNNIAMVQPLCLTLWFPWCWSTVILLCSATSHAAIAPRRTRELLLLRGLCKSALNA